VVGHQHAVVGIAEQNRRRRELLVVAARRSQRVVDLLCGASVELKRDRRRVRGTVVRCKGQHWPTRLLQLEVLPARLCERQGANVRACARGDEDQMLRRCPATHSSHVALRPACRIAERRSRLAEARVCQRPAGARNGVRRLVVRRRLVCRRRRIVRRQKDVVLEPAQCDQRVPLGQVRRARHGVLERASGVHLRNGAVCQAERKLLAAHTPADAGCRSRRRELALPCPAAHVE
jgi:hypothetical protein